MDLAWRMAQLADLPRRALRRAGNGSDDYRRFLFDELVAKLAGRKPRRIVEIGPRDGIDTRRLLTLQPEKLLLIDLPDKQKAVEAWSAALGAPAIELAIGNFMYDTRFADLEPFDVVWCTGVLYHNPEQLRLVRQLFDCTAPGGLIALESATARRAATRRGNCVEIWTDATPEERRRLHVSANVTHLPSARAIRSWLEMVGFADIQGSTCHAGISHALALSRTAFLARRPEDAAGATYYAAQSLHFPIGRSR
jgi:SAM-dependent methyltransferase